MKMNFKKSISTILFSLILFIGFGQKYDFVKIIEGKGIVFNNDSILIEITNIKKTCQILGIKNQTNSDEIMISQWSGYDPETWEDTSGTEWIREIKYKSIVFEFASEHDKDNLKLRWIKTGINKTIKIYTDTGLEIGEVNPNIKELYPARNEKHDYISDNNLTYNLYGYGISFQLKKLENNDLKLIEISTHYKLTE